MNSIAVRDLKATLSAVIGHVRQGHSVTVTLHRRPVARIEPVLVTEGLATIAGVVWRGGGRKLGLHEPAVAAGEGPSVAEILLAQRD